MLVKTLVGIRSCTARDGYVGLAAKPGSASETAS